MKLQNIVYVLTVGGALLTSCSDFLDTESPSVQSSTVTFENEGMTRSAIMGDQSAWAEVNSAPPTVNTYTIFCNFISLLV